MPPLRVLINCHVTHKCATHKSVFVGNVVAQLQLVESDHLLHPLFASAWRVRVDVQPSRHLGVRLAGHHPLAVVELVAAVIHRHDVHQQDVLGLLVQSRHFDFERREHPSVDENEVL